MPELPEVEVTKRGIEHVLMGRTVVDVFIGEKKLRQPLSPKLKELVGAQVTRLKRRGKYIVVFTTKGSLILHLGMTGHLSIVPTGTERVLHDHFELMLDSGTSVRYHDARRFGLVVYLEPGVDPYQYPALAALGPEPLTSQFTGEVLYAALQRRNSSIKQALMNSAVVVGVGNIYACESLFLSKINPERSCRSLTLEEVTTLVGNIKDLLTASIASGGTTIRDFEGADGKLGYFVQNLKVYGHAGEPCSVCGTPIKRIVQGNRSTFYCPKCQH